MDREIKYIGYYDTVDNAFEGRQFSPAAVNKMNYICDVLTRIGYKVQIVSPSTTTQKKFYKGKIIQAHSGVWLKLFPTFPWGNRLQKALSIVVINIMLLWYLISKIKKNEKVIVYHSLALMNVVRVAKVIRRFQLILEVEEIYSDVSDNSSMRRRAEYRFLESADRYIFSTELLDQSLNPTHRPSAVVYGPYTVEEDRNCRHITDKIHVVYSGTFSAQKGGVAAAIRSALFLPANYHVHIIGFGSEAEVEYVKQLTSDVAGNSKCSVTYDGFLRGDDYIRFLQACHIGLSTQTPTCRFNNTSFPSKILAYMTNRLQVVTIRIKAVEVSALGNAVYYYEEQTPEAIANAIMSVNIKQTSNGTRLLKKLDTEFALKLTELVGR